MMHSRVAGLRVARFGHATNRRHNGSHLFPPAPHHGKLIKQDLNPAAGAGMSTTIQEVRTLKEGRYVMMDDEPCKIHSISTSKPGKHGGAKARIEGTSIFNNTKHTIVAPVTEKVQVPLIDKRTAQVLSMQGENVQLMDLQSYETFDLPIPEEFKTEIQPGKDIQYIETMGRKKIMRL